MSDAQIPDGDHYGMGHCAVCGRKCNYGYLMCGPHWRQVPKHIQERVWDALAKWETGGPLGALRNAQADAVGAVVS
jgi:hypothetical protein